MVFDYWLIDCNGRYQIGSGELLNISSQKKSNYRKKKFMYETSAPPYKYA